jgi:hypothetical protein
MEYTVKYFGELKRLDDGYEATKGIEINIPDREPLIIKETVTGTDIREVQKTLDETFVELDLSDIQENVIRKMMGE